MNDINGNLKKNLMLEVIQPGIIALSLVMFFIGVGVAHYLGKEIDWLSSILTCTLIFFFIWTRNLLSAYWDHPESPICILKSSHPRYLGLREYKRPVLLTYALLSLAGAAAILIITLFRLRVNIQYVLLIVFIFISLMATAIPPFLLGRKGYGEIIEALVITIMIPAEGLVISSNNLNPILAMLTAPLLLIYLAVKLAFSFQTYLEDKTGGNPNLLTRLDWEKSMHLHNILIISAYALIAIFALIGLPWLLTWPMLLTLPIAIFEILQMLGILNGGKPNWKIFKWTAGSLAGLLSYMVLLTLWLN
jgi:1,4-dihydroxy-2-naphthoate octaprenyltransferase